MIKARFCEFSGCFIGDKTAKDGVFAIQNKLSNNNKIMKLIDEKIVEEMTSSFGLDLMPKEDSEKILASVLEIISKRTGLRIIEGFTDEETEEFNKIPADDFEQMADFMIRKNPEARSIFAEEAEKVKNEILNSKIESNRDNGEKTA